NASDVRDLISGASKCRDVRRNSCAVQLKQKLLRHRSRGSVLFLPEIRTHADVFRSTKDGGTLRTIRDACDYMTGIGKKRELRSHWQRSHPREIRCGRD